jgi:hypothetical protein
LSILLSFILLDPATDRGLADIHANADGLPVTNKALEVTDPDMDKADLFREAIKTFVRVRVGKRLAALSGAMPEMSDIARRRSEPVQ